MEGKTYSLPIIDGAIDWFIFRRGSYDNLPPFLLGRYVWDSWMIDSVVKKGWNTVTTFTWDRGPQPAYGMHWHHSREHQKDKKRGHNQDRVGNTIIAQKSGGLGDWGRLRGMELGLDWCKSHPSELCLHRRFDYDVLKKKLPPKTN